MRILYLTPSAWTGEYPILRTLTEMGHEVCALEESRAPNAPARWMADHYRDPGDGIRTFWFDPKRGWEKALTWGLDRVFKKSFGGRNLVHRMWIVAWAVERFRPDVIVSSAGFAYGVPAALLKRLGLMDEPLMVSYIGGDILDCREGQVGPPRTPLSQWLIRTAVHGPEMLRPVSPLLEQRLLDDGAPAARIQVCPSHVAVEPHWVEDIGQRRQEVRNAIRAHWGIGADTPLLITVSGNDVGKGMHILAQAWPRIVERIPGCRWLLCGPEHPWLDEGVRPRLPAGAWGERVLFTGRLEHRSVLEHLAAADLNVNPSLCEGLNTVVVEAASVGTPSISSDAAGIEYWLRRHACGGVFSSGDAESLADAVIQALTGPGRLSSWRERTPRLYADFLPQRVAESLLERLQKALP